jgi:NAD(P)H-dependent flavin oxidoreductase YrpB (nitropropane dioxygenase family)
VSLGPTAFTDLIGCRLPLQQAGMGAVSTAALAAAVAGEGGLGMIGAAGLTPADVAEQVDLARGGSDERCVGVNFLLPFLDPAAFEVASSGARVVECFYGDPDPALGAIAHAGGALFAWQAGSRDEAAAAVAAGCDLLVVQGIEAGGHVRGATPLLELLDAVRPVVDLPIVAAGGIGNGRAIADALLAGADAVRVGTRLLATFEANVHPQYADALVQARAEDTVVTEAFSMGWPNAPHRVLRSAAAAAAGDPATRSPIPPTRTFTGPVGSAALYAGTSVTDVRTIAPAAAVLGELVSEAALALAEQRRQRP